MVAGIGSLLGASGRLLANSGLVGQIKKKKKKHTLNSLVPQTTSPLQPIAQPQMLAQPLQQPFAQEQELPQQNDLRMQTQGLIGGQFGSNQAQINNLSSLIPFSSVARFGGFF